LSLAKTGVTADQQRTARMITAAMAEKLEAQGYDLPAKTHKAKRLQKEEKEDESRRRCGR